MAIKNNYISVAYKLYVKEGENDKEELVEECSIEHPFMFISKLNAVLEPFEDELDPLNDVSRVLQDIEIFCRCLESLALVNHLQHNSIIYRNRNQKISE